MINVGISVRSLRLKSPMFNAVQVHSIAEAGLQAERDRIERGLNVEDRPAKPLGPRQAGLKQSLGKPSIRDLNQTGDMLADRQVVESSDSSARIDFSSDRQREKAAANQKIDRQFGLSADDRDQVRPTIVEHFRENVAQMVVRK